MNFYTYIWLRYDGRPYYVGKGKGRRGFISKGHYVGCPKSNDLILIQEWDNEETAFIAEKFLIEFYGRKDLGTGPLMNMTEGGIGGICNTGKRHSPEHCRRISEGLKGKKLSDEHRAKLKKWHTGKVLSPQHCANISAALKKVPCATRIKPGQRLSPATEFKKGVRNGR